MGHVYNDNGSFFHSGLAALSIDSTDMCSTVVQDKMVIVVDNGSTSLGAGFDVFTMHDNGTLVATATDVTYTDNTSTNQIDDILGCSLTTSSDNTTYILAIAENGTGGADDNITILSSDNLTGWDQVYEFQTRGASYEGVISVAAPNGTGDVWVGADDGSACNLFHSDNGTTGNLIQTHTIGTCSLGGIAHDGGASGSGSIGISGFNATAPRVEVYYE